MWHPWVIINQMFSLTMSSCPYWACKQIKASCLDKINGCQTMFVLYNHVISLADFFVMMFCFASLRFSGIIALLVMKQNVKCMYCSNSCSIPPQFDWSECESKMAQLVTKWVWVEKTGLTLQKVDINN